MKFISYISGFMIPFLLFYVVGYGLLSKRDIYSDFLEGAKEGLKTVKGLVPVLVGLMTAVGVLRASGFLDFLGEILGKATSAAGIPPQIVPLGIVRMFSSSAATGLLLDIFKEFGTDSPVGLMAGLMLSSTESVFYCMSVYNDAHRFARSIGILAIMSALFLLIAYLGIRRERYDSI